MTADKGNMEFLRKLPIPQIVKQEMPITDITAAARQVHINEVKQILDGRSKKLLLIIGPCSADNISALNSYIGRLQLLQDEVRDTIKIVPRVYTNKPRTTGLGYKGMLHQPDLHKEEDLLEGIKHVRMIHSDILEETGFITADELLYPQNYRYLSDVLGYTAIGARSVENQEHRLVASGLDIPVGMKNPTGGDLRVMLNAIKAAKSSHKFIYRGWEVQTKGNKYAHAILRGGTDNLGISHPNYYYENLLELCDLYDEYGLDNPAVIIDANHANSNKHYEQQQRIIEDVMMSRINNGRVHDLVKGFMIESYLEDGSQKPGEFKFGQSITDPCIGWDKTLQLVLRLDGLLKHTEA